MPLSRVKAVYAKSLEEMIEKGPNLEARKRRTVEVKRDGDATYPLGHGAVVIAAITSCTNTSNPAVMLGAGLVAKNAIAMGLASRSRGSRPRWRRARAWSPST